MESSGEIPKQTIKPFEKASGIYKSILLSPYVYLIFRLFLAFLFIYGGFSKLIDPKTFAKIISAYDLAPEFLLPVAAIGLPLIETLVGIALAFDMKGSLAAISGLLVFFVLILWYGVLNGLSVDCGCFGSEEITSQNSLRQAFYRDIGLIGIAAYLYYARWISSRTGVPLHKK
jgi:uncharacterized membrane protein YphA (DoxX/SURF4 family)